MIRQKNNTVECELCNGTGKVLLHKRILDACPVCTKTAELEYRVLKGHYGNQRLWMSADEG